MWLVVWKFMKTSCICDHEFKEQEKHPFTHNPKLLDNKQRRVSLYINSLQRMWGCQLLNLFLSRRTAKMASLIQVRDGVRRKIITFVVFIYLYIYVGSRYSSVGEGLWPGQLGFKSPLGQDFSLLHNVQNSFGTHPASYPTGTGGDFFGSKAAGAWSWPLASICCQVQKWWSYEYTSTLPYDFKT
jgi:hypothetical protein